MANKPCLIIAIDFGSTFSGACYAWTTRPDQIYTVKSWPKSIDDTNTWIEYSDMVPTQLRYPAGARDPEWGFQIPRDAPADEILRRFKMALEPGHVPEDTELAKQMTELVAVHDVDRLMQSYLSGLLGHTLDEIRGKFPASMVDKSEVHFVLTVPAIWSEKSTKRTVDALKRCRNFPNSAKTTVLSEPEAAAIYTLQNCDSHGLNVGDSFLVVDAGGGTVDLITYTINSLAPSLEVTETVPGSGGICGSQMLNDRFLQYLDAKLGKDEEYGSEARLSALARFEVDTKRRFSIASVRNGSFTLPVTGMRKNLELGVKTRGHFTLPGTDLHMIFEPVMLQVIALIQEQINASNVPIRTIMLVGGFGQSTYLRERIQSVNDKAQGRVQTKVIRPDNAWLAVVLGAVRKGLSLYAPEEAPRIRVKARRARKHYGHEMSVEYNEAQHSSISNRKWWDGYDGVWRVMVLGWFIRRRDPVSEDEPFYKNLLLTQSVSQGRPNSIKTEIYVDDQSFDAPLVRNKNVKLLHTLEADLKDIPEAELDREKGRDGQMYYLLDFLIESTYTTVSTTYTLIYKDRRYQTVTAEYV